MQARIRPYRESDEAAVLALWEAAGIGRPWLDLRAEIAEKLGRDRELFLVAEQRDEQDAQDEQDGRDGGLGQTRLVGAVMGAYDGRRGWVYHLAVAQDRRRQGIGRQLMLALEAAMAARGISKVNLQVRADNAAAVGFYERLGYADERLTSLGKWLQSNPRAAEWHASTAPGVSPPQPEAAP